MLMAEQSTLPPWFQYMPLLALLGALAAYVGALRLWYHKLRLDTIDSINKESTETKIYNNSPSARDKAIARLGGRISTAVKWLRVLMVIDMFILATSLLVYLLAFWEFMPWCSNSKVAYPAILALLGLLAFCVVHAIAGIRAWVMEKGYLKGAPDGRGRSVTAFSPKERWFRIILWIVILVVVLGVVGFAGMCWIPRAAS